MAKKIQIQFTADAHSAVTITAQELRIIQLALRKTNGDDQQSIAAKAVAARAARVLVQSLLDTFIA